MRQISFSIFRVKIYFPLNYKNQTTPPIADAATSPMIMNVEFNAKTPQLNDPLIVLKSTLVFRKLTTSLKQKAFSTLW